MTAADDLPAEPEPGAPEDDLELETPACPLCRSVDREPLHRLGRYGVTRCRACGVRYLAPRLPADAMLRLYRAADYFEGGSVGYGSYAAQEPALRATFGRFVRRLVAGGRAGDDLLDVGAGYGFLLEAAAPAFRSVSGTELSVRAAADARARGLDVVTGGVDDLAPERRFDLVVATHVVEHLYEPARELERFVGRLRPGGSLVLATPDAGSAWSRILGRRWPSYKVPEHVLYLDRRSLGRLLRDAGLGDLRVVPYPHAFPLGLVAEKAGLRGLGRAIERTGGLGHLPVWLPATTVCVAGRLPGPRTAEAPAT